MLLQSRPALGAFGAGRLSSSPGLGGNNLTAVGLEHVRKVAGATLPVPSQKCMSFSPWQSSTRRTLSHHISCSVLSPSDPIEIGLALFCDLHIQISCTTLLCPGMSLSS